jgi:hypothetical protein
MPPAAAEQVSNEANAPEKEKGVRKGKGVSS